MQFILNQLIKQNTLLKNGLFLATKYSDLSFFFAVKQDTLQHSKTEVQEFY
jgi:hypothetical protein